jgi:hypothetical protein
MKSIMKGPQQRHGWTLSFHRVEVATNVKPQCFLDPFSCTPGSTNYAPSRYFLSHTHQQLSPPMHPHAQHIITLKNMFEEFWICFKYVIKL